jgi:hypothetical protein
VEVKPAGKRQKGSRLERKFAQLIRMKGLDSNAKRMVLSGADWALKSDIYTALPFHFECKNQEKVKLWEWWEQARNQTNYKPPVLVVSGNYRPILCILDANDFLNLIKQNDDR